jgi:hypothetical protein
MEIWCKQKTNTIQSVIIARAQILKVGVLDRSFHFHTWALTVCIAKYLYHTHSMFVGAQCLGNIYFGSPRPTLWTPFSDSLAMSMRRYTNCALTFRRGGKKVSDARGESPARPPGSSLSLRSACVCTQNINDPSYLMWQPPSKRKRESHCIDGPLSYHV